MFRWLTGAVVAFGVAGLLVVGLPAADDEPAGAYQGKAPWSVVTGN